MNDVLDRALDLARASASVPLPNSEMTCERSLTRRGVVWLGQTCNLRCRFCYFIDRIASKDHPEHPFMSLEKAQTICRTLAEYYGNTAVDLQGGEPTIYPQILELVAYCRDINLAPTLITNAMVLDDKKRCKRFQDAGLADFLISVQGLGSVHDDMVGVKGAHERQMKALCNLQALGIPFRFNCVMSKNAVPQLPGIAVLARETGASVLNFITFNPFADQANEGMRSAENVPCYTEVREPLQKALTILEHAGIEGNVRYFPLCMLDEPFRKNIYGFQQLSYDHHEWDFASWGWTGLAPQRTRDHKLSPPVPLTASRLVTSRKEFFKKLADYRLLRPLLYSGHKMVSKFLSKKMEAKSELYRQVARIHSDIHCQYSYANACYSCGLKKICDGFHLDYAGFWGIEEARAVGIDMVDDPKFFISRQRKVEMH